MEKCPPAEACRSAFERMSKATVTMAMSTTGFGFERDREHYARPSLCTTDRTSFSSSTYANDNQYQSQPPQQKPLRRPPPKFDMNLRDLFPDETSSVPLTSQALPPQMQQRQTPILPRPQALSRSSLNQLNRNTSPSPTTLNSQINAGLGMGPPNPFYTPSQPAESAHGQKTPFYNTSGYGSDFVEIPGLDFLDSYNGDDVGGFDLGMSFGDLGEQHDWSEGNGFDLFDGFFFRGNGNGNSA